MVDKLNRMSFGDRLSIALTKNQTPLCVGIDPHISLMPSLFRGSSPKEQIEKLVSFSLACIEAAQGRVPAIKPQVALFEKFGAKGMEILQLIGRAGHDAGLLVIMDAKRGDIGSTSVAYADAWLGENAPFYSDALTVNPFLGIDTLEPFINEAIISNAGLFILLRTSNPGSADLQELRSDNKPIYQHLAEKLLPIINSHLGNTGWSSIGIVIGATNPTEAKLMRALLPSCPFLIPGFGAQGADASMALCGLSHVNRDLGYQGGLITSSREITFGNNTQRASTTNEYISAVVQNIDKSIEKLR